MNKLRLRSRLTALLTTSIVCFCLLMLSRAPALAYGAENWQIAFSGTAVAPSTGQGFGFWGWCALGGGVSAGTNGDCEFAQYTHAPAGSGITCHESLDITSWNVGSNGNFFITGTATVNPTSATVPCLAIFPLSASFTGVDLGVPAVPGHFNLGALIVGLRGTLQIQVTQIP